jgi:Tol biopolymer transport system component/DNA-binding winged helix-turn-helix (wHTH) protein
MKAVANRDDFGAPAATAPAGTPTYEFDGIAVDTARLAVTRAGVPIDLEPKVFDVLVFLITHRERLVTKDELLDAVWRDTFVTPNALTRAVGQLRKALGDDAGTPRYIETVAKRGYRFLVPVSLVSPRSVAGGEPLAAPAARPEPAAGQPAVLRSRRRSAAVILPALLVVGGLTWQVSRVGPGAGTSPSPRPLTADMRHYYMFPALSNGGGLVAYSYAREGFMEVFVRGLAEGSSERQITSDGGGNIQAAFSPDGRWLAYHSRRKGGIWVVPSTGGVPQQVANFGAFPSWAPDNETLVFTSVGSLSSQGQLWTVRRGSPPAPLTQAGNPLGGHTAPAWSHDGRFIVFRVGRDAIREIWLVGRDGGTPSLIAGNATPSTPRFAPDDRAIYWIGVTADSTPCLMRVNLTAAGQTVGTPTEVLPMPGYYPESFSIGRDHTAVFALVRGRVNLWSIDLDPAGDAGVPKQLTFDDAGNSAPSYGPDGRIAFVQAGPSRRATAWLMDEDGSNREQLLAGYQGWTLVPQWDSRGSRLFVTLADAEKQPLSFAWVDLATRKATRFAVAPDGGSNWPTLSPDAKRVAFHVIDSRGVINVWIQDLDTGSRRQITFDGESMSYPRWSRDGKWLAVNVKRGNSANVGVVPVAGGDVEHLTSGAGQRWPYSFSPDHDRVAFAESAGGVWNIRAVSRSTGIVTTLTQFPSGVARYPAWSPAGDRIVFERSEETSGLWTAKLR